MAAVCDVKNIDASVGFRPTAGLNLNGYKISNPTVLARIEHEELEQFIRGCGWTPYFVEGDEPEAMHQLMATTTETIAVVAVESPERQR
jgi:phosphoketolase